MCKKLGVSTREAVIVDDIPANIEGAERAGMAAIRYRNFAQLAADLETLLPDGFSVPEVES